MNPPKYLEVLAKSHQVSEKFGKKWDLAAILFTVQGLMLCNLLIHFSKRNPKF